MFLKETFRVSVIGAGYMAREHIRAFWDIARVKVIGIHSRTRVRAADLASEFDLTEVCNSIAELYDRTRAHLVIVAVPELSTNQVSCECFEFPWAVLIEKPAGYVEQPAFDRSSRPPRSGGFGGGSRGPRRNNF